MSQNTIQVAKKLVQRLPENMQIELAELILRVEEGQDPIVETKIIKILRSHENIRRWMKEQQGLVDKQKIAGSEYIPLGGDPSALMSRKWSCPSSDCNESFPVIQKGEDPPVCEVHMVKMVCGDEEKE